MTVQHLPTALKKGHLCPACNGTGANIPRTLALPASASGYVRCGECNGNGLDPAAYFDWKKAEGR